MMGGVTVSNANSYVFLYVMCHCRDTGLDELYTAGDFWATTNCLKAKEGWNLIGRLKEKHSSWLSLIKRHILTAAGTTVILPSFFT